MQAQHPSVGGSDRDSDSGGAAMRPLPSAALGRQVIAGSRAFGGAADHSQRGRKHQSVLDCSPMVLSSSFQAGEHLAARFGATVAPAVAGLRGALSQLSQFAFGGEFDSRIRQVSERYRSSDPFGLDVSSFSALARVGALLRRIYFRAECHGLEAFPAGPAIVVANHSGQLPLDSAIIASCLLFELNPGRVLRIVLARGLNQAPLVLAALSRFGHVPSDRGTLRALLDRGETVLVFPEGIRGLTKPYRARYQLQRFESEFVEVAQMTSVPIVPLAVIGAEEQYVNIGNLEQLSKVLGIPPLPLVPQLMIPGAQWPLPTRYRLHFGDALRFAHGAADADEVSHRAWLVRQSVQHLIGVGLRGRKRVFW